MMPKDRPRRIYAVSWPSDFLEPRMGEVRRITLPKLFGKSGWAPNRGSEGAREGSKRPDRPLLAAEEARLRGLGLFSKRFLQLDFSHLGTARVSMPVAYPLKGRRILKAPTLYSDVGKEVRSAPK